MQRILIVRLSAIGDVIHGLPVLCALRRALPNAFLGWVVEGRAADLLSGHPALDELITIPRHWLRYPSAVLALRRCLRQLRFDTAIDLQCLTKSAIAARLSGARRRVGKTGADGRELSKWFHSELVETQGNHVIDHYLSLLRPLGIQSPAVEYSIPEHAADAEIAEQFLGQEGIRCGQYLLLNPGAGWPSKIWPAPRYGEVARHASQRYQLPSVVVWAGDSERQLAATVVAHSHRSAVLAPPTTIRQLAALARRARLFVGSDTGPMHLSVAVGTPTISLHGPSRAEWCGAFGPDNIRLQVEYDMGTSRHRRSADNWAMRAITVAMVRRACEEILARDELRQCG